MSEIYLKKNLLPELHTFVNQLFEAAQYRWRF